MRGDAGQLGASRTFGGGKSGCWLSPHNTSRLTLQQPDVLSKKKKNTKQCCVYKSSITELARNTQRMQHTSNRTPVVPGPHKPESFPFSKSFI